MLFAAFTATAGLRRVTTAQRGSTVTRASESGTPEGRGSEDQAERQQQQLQQGLPAADHPDMDPHHRKTVEVGTRVPCFKRFHARCFRALCSRAARARVWPSPQAQGECSGTYV